MARDDYNAGNDPNLSRDPDVPVDRYDRHDRDRDRKSPWGWIIGLLAVLAIALIIGFAVWDDDPETPNVAAATATIDEVAANPAEYAGEQVTLSGDVNNVLGPRSFILGSGAGGQVLVIGAEPMDALGATGMASPAELADDTVQVTGTVRMFNLTEVERDVGADLNDQAFAGWEGRPVIVASNLDRTAIRDTGATPGDPVVAGARQPAATMALVDLSANPAEFYGRDLMVEGVVRNVISPSAFVIAPASPGAAGEVLVVTSTPVAPAPQVGQQVAVNGNFREFDLATVERDLGADWDDQLFADWDDRPAIVANQISPLQGQ